ncbi:MAG: DUF935 family protein [Bilophila wadsworthia]
MGVLIRSYALEANIRYVQVHGLPFRLGKYPPGSREEDRRALYNALADARAGCGASSRKAWDILFETPRPLRRIWRVR